MRFEVRLVHAEPGRRVVLVRAIDAGECRGSALGEAGDAEAAEERALRRLLLRLAEPAPAGPAAEASPTASAAPAEAATSLPVNQPPERAAAVGPNPPQPVSRSLPRHPGPGVSDDSPAAAAPAPSRGPEPEPQAPLPAAAGDGGSRTAAVSAAVARPVAAPAGPGEEAPTDPDDWSTELARLDLALRRLGWSREQEGAYLQRAFGHPSRSRITRYADLLAYLRQLEALEADADPAAAPLPLRRQDLLSQGDALLARLGWDTDTGRRFLREQLAVAGRSQLADAQLLQFNLLLETELIAAAAAPPEGQPAA